MICYCKVRENQDLTVNSVTENKCCKTKIDQTDSDIPEQFRPNIKHRKADFEKSRLICKKDSELDYKDKSKCKLRMNQSQLTNNNEIL